MNATNEEDQSYSYGFQAGERDAFQDRRRYTTRQMPKDETTWARGYIDGYTPRRMDWALRSPDPAEVRDWRRA